MNTAKRLTSALLALTMLASMPVPSLAAKKETTTTEVVTVEETTTRRSLFANWKKKKETTTVEETTKAAAKASSKAKDTTSDIPEIVIHDETTTKKSIFKRKKKETTTAEETTAKAKKETTTKKSGKAKKETTTAAEEKTTKKKKTFKEAIGANRVANVYLLISAAQADKPHVWIYVENISDKPITVGHYTCPAGDSVSLGAWRDRGRGAGIHYNLERYWVKAETYTRTIYLKATITAAELKMVTFTIKHHDYWTWPFNCGWFATSVWNKTTFKQVPYLFWPQLIRIPMYILGAKNLDFTIKKLGDPSRTYKHTKDGMVVMNSSALWTNTGV